ncbi:MAG: histidine kinase dimerization/phospho-acceptor domain-containing protein [Pseudobdellovibrionaceae bacterium]
MPNLPEPSVEELRKTLSDLAMHEAKLNSDIIKKTKGLIESRAKISMLIHDIELLRRCLISLQEAATIEAIESQFLQILSIPFELSWIKILAIPDDQRFISDIEENIKATYLQTPLFRQNEQFGSFIAVKVGKLNFTKSQVQFFSQLSDAISITVDRLEDARLTQMLTEEWQETFISLQHPIALIDRNYDLIQINQREDAKPKNYKKKCFEYLFQRSAPCEGCDRGQKFFIDTAEKSYEVSSQIIQLPRTSQEVYVNSYFDITEARNIHRKMLETAKAAELGLVGSSIAHEINNPLGGLLSYIQLIKMDLSKEDPYFKDFVELEDTTKRCVDIVRSLLEQNHFLRTGHRP